jgi:hypothetical protein
VHDALPKVRYMRSGEVGIVVEDRGLQPLKGLAEPRRLFAVPSA